MADLRLLRRLVSYSCDGTGAADGSQPPAV